MGLGPPTFKGLLVLQDLISGTVNARECPQSSSTMRVHSREGGFGDKLHKLRVLGRFDPQHPEKNLCFGVWVVGLRPVTPKPYEIVGSEPMSFSVITP